MINKLCNYDLLILDEWLRDPLTEKQINFIFDIVEKRYARKSTIFVSQYSSAEWYTLMGSNVKTEAVMDRIVHGMTSIDCGFFNMREYIAGNPTI